MNDIYKVIENKKYKIILQTLTVMVIIVYLLSFFIFQIEIQKLIVITILMLVGLDIQYLIITVNRVKILIVPNRMKIIYLRATMFIIDGLIVIVPILVFDSIQTFYLTCYVIMIFLQPKIFLYLINEYKLPDHFFDPIYFIQIEQ